MLKKLNLRKLIIVFLVSLLWVTGVQLFDHLLSDVPLRFDLVTLLLLPGIVFVALLAYIVTRHLLASLAERSPFWTDYRLRWVDNTFIFLLALGYIDLTGVVLREETYGAVDLIATLVGAVIGGAILAWVDRKAKEETEERPSTLFAPRDPSGS